MVTLNDVAKLAKVSTMTVSRVINNRPGVSAHTRVQVQNAIEELGYSTNLLARGLALGRSGILAYIVSDLGDPYFSLVLQTAEKVSRANGVGILFFGASTEKILRDTFQLVINHKLDGVIMHDLAPSRESLELLQKNNIPCVLVESEENFPFVSTVDINHYHAGEIAAQTLIAQGFRQLFCVHGATNPLESYDAEMLRSYTQRRFWRERKEGFLRAAQTAGVATECLQADTAGGADRYLLGQIAASELLAVNMLPLGVYCEDDMLALGFSGYAQEHGFRLPEDVSIIGSDGLEMSLILYPRLTTLVHPRAEMVNSAIELLLRHIEGQTEAEHLVLEPQLCFGDTTKRKLEY